MRRAGDLGRLLLQGVHHLGERRTASFRAVVGSRARPTCELTRRPSARDADRGGPGAEQRDGCPKIVNLGTSKTDLFYERKKYGFKKGA